MRNCFLKDSFSLSLWKRRNSNRASLGRASPKPILCVFTKESVVGDNAQLMRAEKEVDSSVIVAQRHSSSKGNYLYLLKRLPSSVSHTFGVFFDFVL